MLKLRHLDYCKISSARNFLACKMLYIKSKYSRYFASSKIFSVFSAKTVFLYFFSPAKYWTLNVKYLRYRVLKQDFSKLTGLHTIQSIFHERSDILKFGGVSLCNVGMTTNLIISGSPCLTLNNRLLSI